MIKITVYPSFPEAFLPLFEHPQGLMMCVPMTVDESKALGESLNTVAELLAVNCSSLRALIELAASQPDQVHQLHAMVVKMLEPNQVAAEVFDQIRQVIGRAAFSRRGDGKGKDKGGKLQ